MLACTRLLTCIFSSISKNSADWKREEGSLLFNAQTGAKAAPGTSRQGHQTPTPYWLPCPQQEQEEETPSITDGSVISPPALLLGRDGPHSYSEGHGCLTAGTPPVQPRAAQGAAAALSSPPDFSCAVLPFRSSSGRWAEGHGALQLCKHPECTRAFGSLSLATLGTGAQAQLDNPDPSSGFPCSQSTGK